MIDSTNFNTLKVIKLCNEKVRKIKINKEQSKALIACGDGTIRVFDLNILSEIKSFDAHQLSANVAIFHPNHQQIISGGRDAYIRIWDKETCELIKEIPAHNFAIYDIEFSADNNLYATASRDKTIKIWDASTHNLLLRINYEKYNGHTNSVNCLHWSTYKNYLISGSDDRSILVWEIEY
jgi:WD40 repeat protein